tara:strand:+ start:1453 stop:1956 length:504 start_codon:yes stop_codon:yes gene_type:complete
MSIKLKIIDPKPTDFDIKDIVINTKTGVIFYKNNKNELFKITGDNLNTPNTTEFVLDNLIKGNLNVSGSIIPLGSGSFDLGSETNPWKDLHILESSIKFYDNTGEVGKIQFERGKGIKVRDREGDLTFFSSSVVFASETLKSPHGSFQQITTNGITGSIREVDGGSF